MGSESLQYSTDAIKVKKMETSKMLIVCSDIHVDLNLIQ